MNKNITLLLLAVVAVAMSLVFFFHMRTSDVEPYPIASTTQEETDVEEIETPETSVRSGESSVTALTNSLPLTIGKDTTPSTLEQSPVAQSTTPQAQAAPPIAILPQAAKPQAAPKPQAPVQQASKPATLGSAQSQPPATQANTVIAATTAPAKATPSAAPSLKPLDTTSTTPTAGPNVSLDNLSSTAAHTAKSISLHFSENKIYLRVEADTPFPYKVFTLPTPDRLVVDLPGKWSGVKAPAIPSNQLIKAARIGQQTSGPRIVLDLSRGITFSTKRVGNNVVQIDLQ